MAVSYFFPWGQGIVVSSWNPKTTNDWMVNCSIVPGDLDIFLKTHKKP